MSPQPQLHLTTTWPHQWRRWVWSQMNNRTPTVWMVKEAPISHKMERLPWKQQHMGTCWSSPHPSTYQALSICSPSSVSSKSNSSVSNPPNMYKNPPNQTPNPYRMLNSIPHFPIEHLPKDFPFEKLTPLKHSKYDFDPSESCSNSIFRFRYKLSLKHVLDHHWYCKLDYCPFHHPY